MPMSDYLMNLNVKQAMVDGNYTTDEVNFGVANPNAGRTAKFGAHIIVTTVAGGATEGVYFWVCHAATTGPTVHHMGRFFTLAELAAGKHYFIPCGKSLLQYARVKCTKHTTDLNAGNFQIYFGPDEDGAE